MYNPDAAVAAEAAALFFRRGSTGVRIGIDIHTICIIEVSEKLQRM